MKLNIPLGHGVPDLDRLLGRGMPFERPARSAPAPESDPEYLESLPPRFVIHTVHGTFASRAEWIESRSALCRTLRRELGWRARIEPFRWSGANSIVQRSRAADDLRRHLEEKLREHPQAHHVVVAHSHGGNVAFWAVSEERLARRLLGVATLATPFLSAQARDDGVDLIDPGTAFFAGLFAGWAVMFYGVHQGHDLSLWPWALGVGVALVAAMALGGWLLQGMRRHAARLARCMPASALVPEQVAIVRVQGDEATAAITGVRLAGSLSDLIWRVVSAPLYDRISRLLRIMDYAGMRSLQDRLDKEWSRLEGRMAKSFSDPARGSNGSPRMPREQLDLLNPPSPARSSASNPFERLNLLGGPQPSSAFSRLGATPGSEGTWSSATWQALVTTLPPLVIHYIREGGPAERLAALACLMVVSLPAMFAVATIVLGLPFGLVSALSLMLVDWTAPLAGPYLRVTAEPSPPGTWAVTQFEADREPRGLFHSQAYVRPAAQHFVASWILQRARAVEAQRVGAG